MPSVFNLNENLKDIIDKKIIKISWEEGHGISDILLEDGTHLVICINIYNEIDALVDVKE